MHIVDGALSGPVVIAGTVLAVAEDVAFGPLNMGARVTDILNGLPQAMIVVSHDTQFRRNVATRSVRLVARRIEGIGGASSPG
jgi:ABC-type histidine transport system ATPase subunit